MCPDRPDDTRSKLPFSPGEPLCHHCGTPAPEGTPGPHARCESCHLHLHACRNCMFVLGLGCLLRSPFRWPSVGLPGQDCPDFMWRDDDVASRPDLGELVRPTW